MNVSLFPDSPISAEPGDRRSVRWRFGGCCKRDSRLHSAASPLVGVGAIVSAADPLIFSMIVTGAAVGAALGDWLSYWLGYRYHAQVQTMWRIKNYPRMLDKARSFFRRWGAWGIVIARFSGPLRATVPIAAGIAEMPWLRFQLANWASAFLWAFLLLSPGLWGMQWLSKYW